MGKFDAGKLARSVCKTFQPYVAGKPIETLKRELGLKHIIKIGKISGKDKEGIWSFMS